MSSANFLVRRAVVDDLPSLIPLWRSMNFLPEELEKRLTDFQVAVNGQGDLLGAVALEIAGQQGRIHHEAFSDFGLADHLRPLFWGKIQALSANYHIFQIWTQEDAPFWKHIGLQPAAREWLQNLPAKWSNTNGQWLRLQLKSEAAVQALTSNTELDMMMNMERERRRRTLEKARRIKSAALVVAIIFALFVGMMVLYAFKHDPTLLEKLQQR